MSESEAFTIVTASSQTKLIDEFERLNSAPTIDMDTSITAALRRQYPDWTVTVIPDSYCAINRFAQAGEAFAELDTVTDSISRWRYVFGGTHPFLAQSVFFAKYLYRWRDEYFVVYSINEGFRLMHYILKEPDEGQDTMSFSSKTDELIKAIEVWSTPPPRDDHYIYIFDGWWTASRDLWYEVQKAKWDDVILDPDLKHTLTELVHKFFDSKAIYEDLGVPWKRGIMFHGPAGNGKTISIKALMHSLFVDRKPSIPALYVKSAPSTYAIRSVFSLARYFSPCLLILEDIDTIVTEQTRSYFFNEVDGLENNDGIMMVASTNHLDRLDPGLSSRPSRFDRKYLFPSPSTEERILYCEYWRNKLKNKPLVDFPKKLCAPIAGITQDFSFAYLKEAFVATLLAIAVSHSDPDHNASGEDDSDDGLDQYELWREMKKQVKFLRDDMDNSKPRFSIMESESPPAPKKPAESATEALSIREAGPKPSTVPVPSLNIPAPGKLSYKAPCEVYTYKNYSPWIDPPVTSYDADGSGKNVAAKSVPVVSKSGEELDRVMHGEVEVFYQKDRKR